MLIVTDDAHDIKPGTQRRRKHRERLKEINYLEFPVALPAEMVADLDRIKQLHALDGRAQTLEVIWRRHREIFRDPFGQGELNIGERK